MISFLGILNTRLLNFTVLKGLFSTVFIPANILARGSWRSLASFHNKCVIKANEPQKPGLQTSWPIVLLKIVKISLKNCALLYIFK